MENEKPFASDSRDEQLVKMAPFEVEIKEREGKAMCETIHIEKRNIDQMHPKDREVHSFDRREIREIENSVREKLSKLSWENDEWQSITLTANEVTAMELGLTYMECEGDINEKCKRLSNLLLHHTST